MSTPRVLLAKRPKDANRLVAHDTLAGHLGDVLKVARTLADTVGQRVTESMALQPWSSEDLRNALLRTAFLHDLGKANSQFQSMLSSITRRPQAFRHEYISVWLVLKFLQLDGWLFAGCTDTVRWAALFAALGHHLKVEDGNALKTKEGSGDARVVVFCDHPDFKSCMGLASDALGLARQRPLLPRVDIDLLLPRPLSELSDWLVEACQWYSSARPEKRRFVAAIKSLLIAADVAGSAVPRAGSDPAAWTEAVLHRVCAQNELEKVALANLDGKPTRPFQERVASSSSPVTFVKAGCGSGKTVAAYLWAARRAAERKLFFCYPTTGTATEGFRDYIIPAEMTAESALLHSRAECDLERLLSAEENLLEQSSRIETLLTWDTPLVICTVDQVLGLIQNSRRSLFSFPSIGSGAFVFDEVHQYDDRLFDALIRFLDTFRGAPVLLMTASLPAARLEAIRGVLAGRSENLEVIHGPSDLEQLKRYRVLGPDEVPPWQQVEETLCEGGKVLWVSNTVERCVHFNREARSRGYATLPYHSRYRYCDRLSKHQAVIDAFKGSGPALAVTTQVCEVSLNISADLLVTDLAPVSALIQRMGRLNRWATPSSPSTPRSAALLTPQSSAPYEKAELEQATRWLEALGSDPLSQTELAKAFEEIMQDGAMRPSASAWLDGGPLSSQAPLREAGATIPVIRDEDSPVCVDSQKRPVMKEVTRYSISMILGPVAREIGAWRTLGFAFVAPQGRVSYSEDWGATWAKR